MITMMARILFCSLLYPYPQVLWYVLVGIYWIYKQRVCIFFLHVETTGKQFYA